MIEVEGVGDLRLFTANLLSQNARCGCLVPTLRRANAYVRQGSLVRYGFPRGATPDALT
jgi:hypothetical protein